METVEATASRTQSHKSQMKTRGVEATRPNEGFLNACKTRGPVSLIASNPFKNKVIADYFEGHGLDTASVNTMIFERCFGKFLQIEWGAIILCIDDFNGLGPVFHKLRYLRDERPSVPIILTSFDFKSHDLSVERLAVCDVSIKFPIDKDALDEILATAWKNNKEWVKRSEDFAQDASSSVEDWESLKEGIALAWWKGLPKGERADWSSRVQAEKSSQGSQIVDEKSLAIIAYARLMAEQNE